MKKTGKLTKRKNGFYLNKWFLDFVSDEGKAMIFYAAKLKWKRLEVPYTSRLIYDPDKGVKQESRFYNIYLPEQKENTINWNDPRLKVEGKWEAVASPLKARIFESKEGYLDWHCLQPVSKVSIKIKDSIIKGCGYAEQIIFTVSPWKIPMNELRWGRFSSSKEHLVWIELRDKEKQQWVWYNGEKIQNPVIEDDQITIPSKGIILKLDRRVILESEKKISQVVGGLLRYLPGFEKMIPFHFLMADTYKWLSRGMLHSAGEIYDTGWAIHEFVNFNPQ
jgi:hypothetical protein